jgi:hypothetical protein
MDFTFGKFGAALALSALLNSVAFAQLTVGAAATVSLPPSGLLGMGCNALHVQGMFDVNAAQVNNSGNISIGTTGTLNGGSGTINLSGNWSNNGSFLPGSGSVVFTDGCATGQIQITGTTVFNNLTLTSNNGRTFVLPVGPSVTVNGTLTLQGTAGQPVQLISASSQTAVVNLGPQANVIRNFATVASNVQIGALGAPQSIPTLSDFSLVILALLLAATAFVRRHSGLAGINRK